MIKIGTRKSPMALAQTGIVMDKLRAAFPGEEFEMVGISTEGDRRLDKQLAEFGGKGAFIKEIETALLDGRIDMAVHSAKDMPTQLPERLAIGAALTRDYAADVLMSTHKELPENAVIGTGSARRGLQLKKLYPNAVIKPVRGNIGTRTAKLLNGEFDALMIAEASVRRLGLDADKELYFTVLDPAEFIPAAGQGILAVEVRCGEMERYTSAVNDEHSFMALKAEREFMRVSGGGCHAPSGAYVSFDNGKCTMYAFLHRNGKTVKTKFSCAYDQLSGKEAAVKCLKMTEK